MFQFVYQSLHKENVKMETPELMEKINVFIILVGAGAVVESR